MSKILGGPHKTTGLFQSFQNKSGSLALIRTLGWLKADWDFSASSFDDFCILCNGYLTFNPKLLFLSWFWSKTAWRQCRFENLEWKDSPPHSTSHILQSGGVVEFGSQSTLPAGWAFVALASLHRYQHLAVITLYTEQVTAEGCQCPCREWVSVAAQAAWLKQHLKESPRSGQEGGITDVPFLCLKHTNIFTSFKSSTFLMFLLCFRYK